MAEKADEKALDTAIGLTNQLISLATAVVSVVIATLALFKTVPQSVLANLVVAISLEFVSIVFGLLTHGAIASALNAEKKFDVVYKRPVRLAAVIQWAFFLLGLAVLLYLVASYKPM